jgi:hypothetical protein
MVRIALVAASLLAVTTAVAGAAAGGRPSADLTAYVTATRPGLSDIVLVQVGGSAEPFRCSIASSKITCRARGKTGVLSTQTLYILGVFTSRAPEQATNELVVSSHTDDPNHGNDIAKTTLIVRRTP